MVKNELPPSGTVQKGFYINSSQVTPSMFDPEVLNKRDEILETSMPFLYGIIQSILTHHQQERVRVTTLRRSRRENKKTMMKLDLTAFLPLGEFERPETIDESGESSNDQPRSDEDTRSLDSDEDSMNNFPQTPVEDSEFCDFGPTTVGKDNEYIHTWNGDIHQRSKDKSRNIKSRCASVSLKSNRRFKVSKYILMRCFDHSSGHANDLFDGCQCV